MEAPAELIRRQQHHRAAWRRRSLIASVLCCCIACSLSSSVAADEAAPDAPPTYTPRLRIAFSSYRRTSRQPKVYFYEHDGVSQGSITGTIETADKQSDTRPGLSQDGSLCVLAQELENNASRIMLWQTDSKQFVDLPQVNETTNAQLAPTMSGDGHWLAWAAWSRPGANTRWDIILYDASNRQVVLLPQLNTPAYDERFPSLSADGQWLACVTNDPSGVGTTDIFLWNLQQRTIDRMPKLNSTSRDVDPSLSADGRWLAFASDRPEGAGGRDIYLFDRETEQIVPLPGLNSVGHEQSPGLSGDGRYIVFVSERIEGAGQRDVYLYDRVLGKLLETPGLNAREEDLDPFVLSLTPPDQSSRASKQHHTP